MGVNPKQHAQICSNMLKCLAQGNCAIWFPLINVKKKKSKRLLSHYFQCINYVKSIVMINLHNASEAKIF